MSLTNERMIRLRIVVLEFNDEAFVILQFVEVSGFNLGHVGIVRKGGLIALRGEVECGVRMSACV